MQDSLTSVVVGPVQSLRQLLEHCWPVVRVVVAHEVGAVVGRHHSTQLMVVVVESSVASEGLVVVFIVIVVVVVVVVVLVVMFCER